MADLAVGVEERFQVIGPHPCASVIRLPSDATTQQVTEELGLKHRLGSKESVARRYSVVLVHSAGHREGGSDAPGGGGAAPPRREDPGPSHFVRTLRSGEVLHEARFELLSRIYGEAYSSDAQRQQFLNRRVRWFLKDRRTTPLNLGEGYMSGAESSDDEASFPWRDLGHLRSSGGDRDGIYSGFLMKRSGKDVNVWRRRYCILTEDKLWFLKSRRAERRSRAPFVSLVNMRHAIGEPDAQECVPFGLELHTAHRSFVFRAYTREDQGKWLQWLRRVTEVNTTNEYIALAEHMVQDGARAAHRRMEATLEGAVPRDLLCRRGAAPPKQKVRVAITVAEAVNCFREAARRDGRRRLAAPRLWIFARWLLARLCYSGMGEGGGWVGVLSQGGALEAMEDSFHGAFADAPSGVAEWVEEGASRRVLTIVEVRSRAWDEASGRVPKASPEAFAAGELPHKAPPEALLDPVLHAVRAWLTPRAPAGAESDSEDEAYGAAVG